MSDRDKGLIPALRDVFPQNREMSCAKHIEAKVSKEYGKQCGQHVVAMALSFSTRYSSELLDNIRAMKEAAATHLEGIAMSGILWQSTQWLNADPCLPPFYGIVTSNTSECVKSMLAEARNLAGQKLWRKFWTLCPLEFVHVDQTTSSARIGTLCRELLRF